MFYKSIASEGKLVFRRAWDARCANSTRCCPSAWRPVRREYAHERDFPPV